jgi:hypothetical protein
MLNAQLHEPALATGDFSSAASASSSGEIGSCPRTIENLAKFGRLVSPAATAPQAEVLKTSASRFYLTA